MPSSVSPSCVGQAPRDGAPRAADVDRDAAGQLRVALDPPRQQERQEDLEQHQPDEHAAEHPDEDPHPARTLRARLQNCPLVSGESDRASDDRRGSRRRPRGFERRIRARSSALRTTRRCSARSFSAAASSPIRRAASSPPRPAIPSQLIGVAALRGARTAGVVRAARGRSARPAGRCRRSARRGVLGGLARSGAFAPWASRRSPTVPTTFASTRASGSGRRGRAWRSKRRCERPACRAASRSAARIPRSDFLYPGIDLAGEAAATARAGVRQGARHPRRPRDLPHGADLSAPGRGLRPVPRRGLARVLRSPARRRRAPLSRARARSRCSSASPDPVGGRWWRCASAATRPAA